MAKFLSYLMTNQILNTQLLENLDAPYIHAYLSTSTNIARRNKTTGLMKTHKNPKTISYLNLACIFLDYNNDQYGSFKLSLAKYL